MFAAMGILPITSTATPPSTFVEEGNTEVFASTVGGATFTTTTPVVVPAGKSIVISVSGRFDSSGGNWNAINAPVVRAYGSGSGGTSADLAETTNNGLYGAGIWYQENVSGSDKDGSNQIELFFDANQPPRTFDYVDVRVYVVDNLQATELAGVTTSTGSSSSPVSITSATATANGHGFFAVCSQSYSDLSLDTVVTPVGGDVTNIDTVAARTNLAGNKMFVAICRDSSIASSSTSAPTVDTNRFTAYAWVSAIFADGS